MRDAPCQGQ
jgi:hypothetical protein